MTSRWLWAVLTCAGAGSMLLSGCSSVDSCKELDKGCLNGTPDNGKCLYGLVPNAAGTACVKKDDGSSTGGGGNNNSCGCASGQLCRSDGTCNNPCAPLTNLPATKPVLPACRPAASAAAYDFPTAAIAACYQACSHRAEYCGGTCDPTKECTSALAAALAVAICPTQAVECAMTFCETTRDTKCVDQKCAAAAAPSCAGVVCSDTCSTAAFNDDGECDDSDLSNATSAACDWGTDCGDCGPRHGAAPSFSLQLGDPCFSPLQCGGNSADITTSTGWCLVPDTSDQSRCLPDCSLGKKCPAGFTCEPLELTDTHALVMDSQGNQAKACFPTACGT